MAEAFLRSRVDRWGLDVTVASAGFLDGGVAPPPEAVAAVAPFGVDTSAHRSRRCTAADVDGADVVLGMARSHVREAVVLDAAAWSRAFTLKELVRRGDGFGPRRADVELDRWLGRLAEGRQRSDVLGSSDTDDVADPIGGPQAAFDATARELATLVDRLVALVWPPTG
jgi:protein-tyrosine phosphatase